MKKLGIGLVGAGCIGTYHSKGYSRVRQVYGSDIVPEFVIACDINEDRAREACDKFGYKKYTTDYNDVVNNKDVDIVLVTVPNYIHAEIAIAAALAGKNVMCEKPMAMTVEESKKIVDAVQSSNVKSLVNFTYTKLPMTIFAKELIEKGKIGDIISFRGYFDCDYCLNPNTPSTWRQYSKYAGTGALGDLTAHVIALSDMLIGSEIEEVFASSDIVFKERPKDSLGTERVDVDTDDQVYIIVKYKNGRIGQMSSSRVAAGCPADVGFEIHGTKGGIRYSLTNMNDLELFLAGDPEAEFGWKTIKSNANHGDYGLQTAYPVAGIGYSDVFTTQAYDFMKAIVKDEKVKIDIAYAHKVDLIMFAMQRSAIERRWVKVSEI